ncbi:MAG: radical SAM protein [Candidatus Eremiobacteraeota bacterium]|nr:radical SAM protein [Candidatus Eremiobacteraeota bacterium]
MPEIIVVEATNRCNLNCRHCNKNINDMGGTGPVDIDLRLLDHILEQTEPYKTRIVAITGGEPTLHSDWEGLIAVMERHDIDYTITSNGQNFKEAYKLIVQGASQRFRGFAFSIDGATAETNDAIRGEGSFAKVKEAFRLARMHGIPFSVQVVVGTFNINELEQIAKLADEAGALELNYTIMKPTLENAQYMLSPAQIDEVEKQIDSIREAHKRMAVTLAGTKTRYPLSVCRPQAMSMIGIDCHGHLRFCPDLSNYRGAAGADSDIVDDLNTTPLQFALKELSNKINKFCRSKIDWVMEGNLTSSEHDPCLYCVSHFNKYECMEV